jgi:probable F420-dependent oxidoreductase
MKVGIQFPSSTIGQDPADVRTFAIDAENAGFHHLSYGEHILWAVKGEGDARASHTYHDVLTTMAYHAAVTSKIELFAAIFVLPQRQAQLVAKQCAQVDLLSNGRMRAGVGVGSLTPEYDALGADFRHRGRIIEEQITLMRALWTNDWAEYHGTYHNITGAALGITPIQRPIPVWLGGSSDAVLERVGRIGDGWLATARHDRLEQQVATIRAFASKAGRDPASVGVQGRIFLENKTPDQWRTEVARWQSVDATHIDIRDDGLQPTAHIEKALAFCQATDLDL